MVEEIISISIFGEEVDEDGRGIQGYNPSDEESETSAEEMEGGTDVVPDELDEEK